MNYKKILNISFQYLQMMTSYFIYKEDMARVAEVFESFNANFNDFCSIFKKVTGQDLNLAKFDMRLVRKHTGLFIYGDSCF